MTSAENLRLDPQLLAAGQVRLETDGAVATVVLDRPDVLNAQTEFTWAALAHIGATLPPEVRVVVVRGAGRSFSAGLDQQHAPRLLADLAALDDRAAHRRIEGFQQAFSWLTDPAFVSVAAVQGHAVGAGFQLALACDLVIAADDARFSMFEVNLGLVPDLGGTYRLTRAVGERRALELCLTGRRVAADEARLIGLVAQVLPVADLTAGVDRFVTELLGREPGAVAAIARLVWSVGNGATESEQLARERQEQVIRIRAIADRPGRG